MFLLIAFIILFFMIVGWILYSNAYIRQCVNPTCKKPKCDGSCERRHVCNNCGNTKMHCRCRKNECPFC